LSADQPRSAFQGRDLFVVCNTVDEIGGVQRWARRMAELFAEGGHRVRLIGIFAVADPHDFSADADHAAAYSTSLIHPDRYGAKPRPALLSRIANPLSTLRYKRWAAAQRAGADRLSALFAEADPKTGVVICAQVHAMEWVALADRHGMPVIAMSHESYAASAASSRARRVKKLYPDAARFLSLTEADAERWTRDGAMNNTAAMPNPLPLPAIGGADPGARVVVAAGRLSQEKGFDLLIEAWAAATAGRPGWTLRIHGSGPERERLAEQAASLGVAGTVDLAGQTGDIAAALVGGSIFASSSRAEGFPMSLLEAMACGLPCVAFDCAPGVREIVRDGVNGIVVAPGNTEAFAAALARLMDERDERTALGRNAVGSVAPYAPEVIVERWERMLKLVHR
jgi:glycosyltransferase involved in cell wall biosynthesis